MIILLYINMYNEPGHYVGRSIQSIRCLPLWQNVGRSIDDHREFQFPDLYFFFLSSDLCYFNGLIAVFGP